MNSSHLWEANPCFCLFPVSLQAGLSQVGPHAAATSALAFAERLFSQDIAHSDAEPGLGSHNTGTGRCNGTFSLFVWKRQKQENWRCVKRPWCVKMISYWVIGSKFVTGSGGIPAKTWYPSKRFNKQVLTDRTWKWDGSCMSSIIKLLYMIRPSNA